MHVFLWILQILLALHTAIGAVWKFFNPNQTIPSLAAIPHGIWLGMGVAELFLSLGLILPAFHKPLAFLVPVAALCIAAEMLLFCGFHIASGNKDYSSIIYWLVVAAVCAAIAYGRLVLRPF